jgi:hypothetical protein
MDMGVDVDAISAISGGTKRRVIASVDTPSADSCRMSLLVSMFMGTSAAGVGGIVVLRARFGGVGSSVGIRKCFQMGQVTEVDVWPCAALWFPWAMQRKHDGGQSHPWPLCWSLRGQLK